MTVEAFVLAWRGNDAVDEDDISVDQAWKISASNADEVDNKLVHWIKSLSELPVQSKPGEHWGIQKEFLEIAQLIDRLRMRQVHADVSASTSKHSTNQQYSLPEIAQMLNCDPWAGRDIEHTLEDFLEEEEWNPANSKYQLAVLVKDCQQGRESQHLIRKVIAENMTTLALQEELATEWKVEASQLQLHSLPLGEKAAPFETGFAAMEVIVSENDWQDKVNKWPLDEHRKELVELLTKLSNLSLPNSPDKTWGSTAEFSEIVDLIAQLLEPVRSRGVGTDAAETTLELLNLLKDKAKEHGASPKFMLEAIRDEY
eukprot:gnl/MRDRNA2_/MRDRNA2_165820_c0_seq1.p1 gnl/MRDRNA2_/MRDRNA2_165820_c0~~gnl/MRDRNA2_/MRDRNA2_165820_c0_seq1.p1  ORF type:complete len:314 (-),score=68.86 gnl/MRDRNA2_/MRDRNA2_165820_c0_seq1:188-1129(-)